MTMPEPEIVELEAQDAIAVRGELSVAELPEFFGRAFHAAMAAAQQADVEITGPPFGYYPVMPTDLVTLEAGFPVAEPVHASGEVHPLVLPAGRAVVAVHVGPFDTLSKTYEELQTWMEEQAFQPAGAIWETYLSDPAVETDPATWRTQIVWPIF